jgi:uncharacterized protein (TIGR01777 family)
MMPPPAESAAVRRVAITGASGLLGSALATRLRQQGITVHRIKRGSAAAAPDVAMSPTSGIFDLSALEGVDAIVNLAGEPIAQRWTEKRKAAIRQSRLTTTSQLADAMARLRQPPQVLLSGSAVGYYGDRGNEELDENSGPGSDFLADVAVAWEQAAETARRAGTRVVLLRTGIVLSPAGGALAKMLMPFKFGLGGRIGSGAQWMSWIALDDWVSAVVFALRAFAVVGPVNLVAPSPVPNAEFTATLARVLGRPTLGIVPELAVDLLFGEMGRATLLASQRVHPRRLIDAGFEFAHPTLEQALRAERGAPRCRGEPRY